MLTHLRNKINALESFSFEKELIDIVTANKDKLADLQRDQLEEGKDSNNDYIKLKNNAAWGYGYRPLTVDIKQSLGVGIGAITSHVTWFMTGELHKSIKAFISGAKFRIMSNDFKFDSLLRRSGEDTIGLNVESRTDFVMQVTRPNILDAYYLKVTRVS